MNQSTNHFYSRQAVTFESTSDVTFTCIGTFLITILVSWREIYSSEKSDFKFGLYYVAPIVHLKDVVDNEFAITKVAILGELDKWAHFSPNRLKQARVEEKTYYCCGKIEVRRSLVKDFQLWKLGDVGTIWCNQ